MSSESTANPQPLPAQTKIVATIGPASEDLLGELIDAGLSVARINFSHGTHEEHRRRIERVRETADARMCAVGILADIPGPKMRLGRFEGGVRRVRAGDVLTLREGDGLAGEGEAYLNFTGFLDAVDVGHRIVLADGQVELIASEKKAGAVVAECTRGGNLADRKGVHLPVSPIRYELPTAADREHLEFLHEIGVDMVGVSFVGCAEELREVRKLVPNALIVAKVERAQALENLEEILEETDGIMVARGDLGVETELEQLPLIQKRLIKDAMEAGKFTITATEMLESMIHSSRPTRAEVADVANAILDGTDAVMLSAETAVGSHPVAAVETMREVALAVESSQRYRDMPQVAWRSAEHNFANATALAAVQAQEALSISKIVVFTESGNTARLLSSYRPHAEIIALSPHSQAVQQMTVLSAVRPILFRREPSIEDMLYMAAEMLVVRGLADYGTEIVFVAGTPPGIASSTNVMKLHRIGEEVKLH